MFNHFKYMAVHSNDESAQHIPQRMEEVGVGLSGVYWRCGMRYSWQGTFYNVYRVECHDCNIVDELGMSNHHTSRQEAETFFRGQGWSHKKWGWHCWNCGACSGGAE